MKMALSLSVLVMGEKRSVGVKGAGKGGRGEGLRGGERERMTVPRPLTHSFSLSLSVIVSRI